MKMKLSEIIENLSTTPFNLDEEYQFSSEFLEWFYNNLYRQDEYIFRTYEVLHSIQHDIEYKNMLKLCSFLINVQLAKYLDNDTRIKLYNTMKFVVLSLIERYSALEN